MVTGNTYNAETSVYWNLIKDVKDEIKIRLITLLSESLTNTLTVRMPSKDKDEATEKFLNKYYGAWKGSEPTEVIIERINEGKTSKPPVSFN